MLWSRRQGQKNTVLALALLLIVAFGGLALLTSLRAPLGASSNPPPNYLSPPGIDPLTGGTARSPVSTAVRPTPTPARAPSPTPLPSAVPMATRPATPEPYSCGSSTDFPEFLGSELLPGPSADLRALLLHGGTVAAARAGWTFNTEDVVTVLDARVYAYQGDLDLVINYYRSALTAGRWAVTVEVPRARFLRQACMGTKKYAVIAAFEANELTPLNAPQPGFLVIVATGRQQDYRTGENGGRA